MFRSTVAASFTVLSLAATPALAADGAQLFAQQCKLCHQAASSPLAPSLAGAAGGKIAARSDFNYSPALKAHGGTWTDANLDAWLTSPSNFARGAKMMVSVPSPENRAAIIGYLKTLK